MPDNLDAYIPFNQPYLAERAFEYIRMAVANRHLAGNGAFTARCQSWLEEKTGVRRALLTHSGTGALEMAAIVARVGPSDEVIMPSYTFVSTANAFVLRGATPVFVDVRPDTLNIDETKIADAITPRTRAIVAVHYAGVACELDAILAIARSHNLLVIEDAAQGLLATYHGRPLGGVGHLAAVSFHETKNVISGEGGALLIKDPVLVDPAEIAWEKGTNRHQFFRGHVDKYTWMDIGSSFLPSEITAAVLWSQLEEAQSLTEARLRIWRAYHDAFADLERRGAVRRPIVPDACGHNAHLYYLLAPNLEVRTAVLRTLNAGGVNAIFHYVPLHNSPAGLRFGRSCRPLRVTEDIADRVLRLPLWIGMREGDVSRVVARTYAAFERAPV